ncbi:MAG: HAD hydrolase family protein [Acidobacteriota bacterium]|nr:HAD hydrolase family protein [Blastocatellia bacterium]MDQ3220956.1 HAD hydrolase family protein [Acidobacteriota bacterium]MDQ3490180.1 HAD hydrolase family protein [Acidobacteriota bacterium]
MNDQNIDEAILSLARKVKLLLMDCDGVLTDGRLYFSERGEEMKVFHVRDGQGLVMWHHAGFRSGIITGRNAGQIVDKRAAELGIHYVKVRSIDKVKDFEEILADANLTKDEAAFIGDDVGDITLLKRVGFPIAVADAVPEVKEVAAFITQNNGGLGAIREVTELLMKAHRKI